MNRNVMGFDGFTWFQGVVEDHNDPEQIGRVKVRCVGIHTEDKETLPTDDLPWAMVICSTSATTSSVSSSTRPSLRAILSLSTCISIPTWFCKLDE